MLPFLVLLKGVSMARKVTPLSDTEIKSAKPKDKEYNLSDGDGLILRIKPSGSKLWLFNYYRPFTKKRTNIGFGKYPEVTLAKARKKRDESRRLLTDDIDPKEHKLESGRKQSERISNTLITVAKNWFEIKKNEISPDYAEDMWRSLELHIFPELGNYPISSITAPITIKAIQPLAAKGTLETVKRVSQRLNEIMVFAVNTGIIHSNPLAGIKAAFQNPTKQNMPTIKPLELPSFMKNLSIASIKLVTRYLIEWQLHTMVRPGEAVKARWSEIDYENQLWNIPADTMKKKRPHAVPLSEQVLNLLESIKPITGHREFIFPADRNPRNHANESTANMAIKRMGYKDKLVAHGLRALASTTLNEQGFDTDVIEAALSHVDDNEVRRAYNRADYIQRRAKMMQWWSEHIENSAMGNLSLSANHKGLSVVNG
ncbi:MAG: integrase [Cocleimonas sp.]|jgi:integrase